MDIISKVQNIMFTGNYYIWPYNFYLTVICNEKLLEKFNFQLLHAFNYSCTWNKETSSCRENIVTFQHKIPYMVNSFIFSLDIPVTINNLYEMIKILHEKMLNGINLYWFHNDTLVDNNALN